MLHNPLDISCLYQYINELFMFGTIVLLYIIYTNLIPSETVKIYCRDTVRNTFLQKECSSMLHYHPAWYLKNAHIHALLSSLMYLGSSTVDFTRMRIKVKSKKPYLDGVLALDNFSYCDSLSNNVATIILSPGLTGDSQSYYCLNFVRYFRDLGYRVLCLNWRGSVEFTNSQLYCASYIEDYRQGIIQIGSLFPDSPLIAISFSLSSNILLKYLIEMGKDTPLTSAISISAPYDLILCSRKLHSSWIGRQYSKQLAKSIVRKFSKYSHLYKGSWNDLVLKTKYIRDFDQIAITKMFYYPTVDAYYRDSLTVNLQSIQIPTLLISALDDPLCTSDAIPYDEAILSDNVLLLESKWGSHSMLFLKSFYNSKSNSWAAEVTQEYIQAIQKCKLAKLHVNVEIDTILTRISDLAKRTFEFE